MIQPAPHSSITTTPDGSFVLRAAAWRHAWQGEGWLSIKSFRGGVAHYETVGSRFAVDDRSYLLLNHGEAYRIEIEADVPVESCCVFFAPDLARDVLHTCTHADRDLLGDPIPTKPDLPRFWSHTYPHDDLVSPMLWWLRDARIEKPDLLTEQLHLLLRRLLLTQADMRRVSDGLPAARAATRIEIYRRLLRAREHIAASLDQPLTLDQLAAVAAMSPNHLLRSFKQCWGQTPHQYVIDVRLDRACHLLRTTNRSITEICFAIGFESLGSFSALFHRRVGVSPQEYRRQTR
jgi:AraC family transcriptional regulator